MADTGSPEPQITANSPSIQSNNSPPHNFTASQLKKAIIKSSEQRVQQILISSPHLLNKSPECCLLYACLHDHHSIVKFILAMPCLKGQRVAFSEVLIQTIRHSNLPMVKTLIQGGCDFSSTVPSGGQALTAIDYCILGGHYSIATFLYPLLKHPQNQLKTAAAYSVIGKRMKYRFVDYQKMIEGIKSNEPFEDRDVLAIRSPCRLSQRLSCWDWICRSLGRAVSKEESEKESMSTDDGDQVAGTSRGLKN